MWVPKTSGQLAMLATLKLKQSFENDRIQILFYQATGIPHLINIIPAIAQSDTTKI